jgi:peptidoglycan/LPS O-acetylase OafA/YrhL
VPGIDLLRGLSILGVVLHHINTRIHFSQSSLGQSIGPAANKVLFWSGYYGVIVFFVISGFLITTWSLKRWGRLASLSRRQFYAMRFARIAPCLLGLLAILAVLHLAGAPNYVIKRSTLPRALLAALTFHVNWLESLHGYLPASWDVLWSLSIEEVFYLFFPLLCTLLRRPALILAAFSCFLVLGPWARVHSQGLWADYGYLSGMDGIALGCLAAMAVAKLRPHAGTVFALALGVAGALLCLLFDVFRLTAFRTGLYKIGLDVTALELGAALILIALQLRFESKALRDGAAHGAANPLYAAGRLLFRSTAFLRWFGRNSYEVYLTHMFMIWPAVWLFSRLGARINLAPWFFLIATALCGLLGWLVARFYSEPLNRRIRASLVPRKIVVQAVATNSGSD